MDGNLLLISPRATQRLRARAERSPHHVEHLLQGGRDASCLSLAKRGIELLLASDPSFRRGLHRNTHCWTGEAAEHDKGLCYQRAAQELMGMTAGMVKK